MSERKRTVAQTSIVGRRQTTIGGKGPGWFREPRRHHEAALKGWKGRNRGNGTQATPFRYGEASARMPMEIKRPEPEKIPFERRYDQLVAPQSDAALPGYFADGGSKYTSREGTAPKMEDWEIENGFIVSGPAYETHRRGKNWMATIEPDPTAPGGLKRNFIDRGNGKYLYRNSLEVGDVYEVGADYYSGGGSKRANREYGVVIEDRGRTIKTLRFKDPDDAIRFSREMKKAREWSERN